MFTRREVLLGMAAGAVAAGLPGCSGESPQPQPGAGAPRTSRPNFLILLTDQERYPRHWPQGLRERLMPSWERLAANGLTFRNAYCASSQCSPSRACLLTGQFSTVNQVPFLDFPTPVLPGTQQLPNLATVLDGAGYQVAYKGKWHLSFPLGFGGGSPGGEVWTAADIPVLESNYGLPGWNPPDAGNTAFPTGNALTTLGGGDANNDGRYVLGAEAPGTPGFGEGALDYLEQVAAVPADQRPPFCLFVSLVNPHDIAFFPNGWDQAGYRREDFAGLGVGVPPNASDDLTTKPSIQALYRDALEQEGPLPTPQDQEDYGNFYAYLHGVVEPHIQAVLDALDRLGLTRDTVVIRTADHGELGLSHALREKSYSAYEEMIHVPLVVSNPVLFPRGAETAAMWSHLDLLATVAELAGAAPVGVGTSQAPVLRDPAASVQDSVLFAFDDNFLLDADTPGSHIRALREERFTYAVYFSADGSLFEYELYDNLADPLQQTNLLFQPTAEILPEWRRLHDRLTQRLNETACMPGGLTWPALG